MLSSFGSKVAIRRPDILFVFVIAKRSDILHENIPTVSESGSGLSVSSKQTNSIMNDKAYFNNDSANTDS